MLGRGGTCCPLRALGMGEPERTPAATYFLAALCITLVCWLRFPKLGKVSGCHPLGGPLSCVALREGELQPSWESSSWKMHPSSLLPLDALAKGVRRIMQGRSVLTASEQDLIWNLCGAEERCGLLHAFMHSRADERSAVWFRCFCSCDSLGEPQRWVATACVLLPGWRQRPQLWWETYGCTGWFEVRASFCSLFAMHLLACAALKVRFQAAFKWPWCVISVMNFICPS